MKVVYSEKSLESLKEITDFLKQRWTKKELKTLQVDIQKIILSVKEGLITYPKYKKHKEIKFALVGKKQVKIFFEISLDVCEILLFWPSKSNPEMLQKLLEEE